MCAFILNISNKISSHKLWKFTKKYWRWRAKYLSYLSVSVSITVGKGFPMDPCCVFHCILFLSPALLVGTELWSKPTIKSNTSNTFPLCTSISVLCLESSLICESVSVCLCDNVIHLKASEGEKSCLFWCWFNENFKTKPLGRKEVICHRQSDFFCIVCDKNTN